MSMKEWMKAMGISYRALASDMGISPSAICKRLNGDVEWNRADLCYLKQHYGLSSDFVLGLTSSEGREVVLSG